MDGKIASNGERNYDDKEKWNCQMVSLLSLSILTFDNRSVNYFHLYSFFFFLSKEAVNII